MQQFAPPQGSFLDAGTSTLMGIAVSDFIGRGQGPPLARWRVHDGGQTAFAHLQIAICLTAAVLYHVVLHVVPGTLQSPSDVPKSSYQKSDGAEDTHTVAECVLTPR
jgi:hypothetical protein